MTRRSTSSSRLGSFAASLTDRGQRRLDPGQPEVDIASTSRSWWSSPRRVWGRTRLRTSRRCIWWSSVSFFLVEVAPPAFARIGGGALWWPGTAGSRPGPARCERIALRAPAVRRGLVVARLTFQPVPKLIGEHDGSRGSDSAPSGLPCRSRDGAPAFGDAARSERRRRGVGQGRSRHDLRPTPVAAARGCGRHVGTSKPRLSSPQRDARNSC